MADSGHHCKRIKIPTSGKQKLLIGEKVEVRSIENGYQGSWHSGVIVECRSRARIVKYDNLLCDDESDYRLESVEVSSVVDGIFCSLETSGDSRVWIRPSPPVKELAREKIHYGLCVDAYYNDAWWEGVVFDSEDGSDNRKVFFPDVGNEKNVRIENLRITHDWDEVTGEWKCRGNWSFLEMIKEIEMDNVIPVSVKQIWFNLREKEYGQIVVWASLVKHLWKKLIEDVINDHLRMTVDEFLISYGFSESRLEIDEPICTHDSASTPIPNPAYSQEAIAPVNISLQDGESMTEKVNGMAVVDAWAENPELAMKPYVPGFRIAAPFIDQVVPVQPNLQSVTCSNLTGFTECSISNGLDDPFSGFNKMLVSRCKLRNNADFSERNLRNNSDSNMNSLDSKRKQFWYPAIDTLKLKPEFCPSSIPDYLKTSNPNAAENVRNHLFYLGWKIEYANKNNIFRVRYTSPQGKRSYSLRDLCRNFMKHEADNWSPTIEAAQKRIAPPGNVSSNLLLIETHKSSEQTGKGEIKRAYEALKCVEPSVEPEYCPESVFMYLKFLESHSKKGDHKELVLKVRKHLKAIGWRFWFRTKRDKEEWRYDSPTTKTYYSLMSACRAIAEGAELNPCNTSISFPAQGVMCIEEPKGHSSGELTLFNAEAQLDSFPQSSKNCSMLWQYRDEEFRKLQKQKKNGFVHSVFSPDDSKGQDQLLKDDEFANELENGEKENSLRRLSTKFLSKKRRSLGNVKSSSDSHNLSRVLRSSKRIRQAGPSSSSHVPRTVLSWLLDNNVVSVRKNIYYRRKKDLQPIAKGRITRDGIRCDCCLKVFTLSAFEAHAGSNCHEPTTNLFLEDGRSLVECQMEILRKNCEIFTKEPCERAKGELHQSWNDHICSICHYGGELILCDQCPSSFHTDCLNLQKIPEGDWLCPSCCCGICGESQFDVNTEQFTDKSVLSCHQCERQYHVHCIRDREMIKLDIRPEEEWFCSTNCGKIHWGLQQLLGKRILVGHDNLTWTLIKPLHYEASKHDEYDAAIMAENYSKLSIAVEVMHECFEPVEEPQTRRGIVKDVIFCRSSYLNRLNFRGFYTVLLERNDELITVATLRVHGSKVAEIPFIGTRFPHRGLGMCRILMNEIEKNLIELGVDKLVLPASASVLNFWTTSFGFSPVNQSEKSEFLGYTFMDFQETVMCQKLLRKRPSCLSPVFRNMPAVVHREPPRSNEGSNSILDFEGNRSISDVFQDEQVEGSENADRVAQATNTNDREIEPRNTSEYTNQIQEKVDREKCDASMRFYRRENAMDPKIIFRSPTPLTQC